MTVRTPSSCPIVDACHSSTSFVLCRLCSGPMAPRTLSSCHAQLPTAPLRRHGETTRSLRSNRAARSAALLLRVHTQSQQGRSSLLQLSGCRAHPCQHDSCSAAGWHSKGMVTTHLSGCHAPSRSLVQAGQELPLPGAHHLGCVHAIWAGVQGFRLAACLLSDTTSAAVHSSYTPKL